MTDFAYGTSAFCCFLNPNSRGDGAAELENNGTKKHRGWKATGPRKKPSYLLSSSFTDRLLAPQRQVDVVRLVNVCIGVVAVIVQYYYYYYY